jgi:uncharacterized membrane protein
MLLGTLGFGLLATALRGKGDVYVERTMEIEAPIDHVFEFFANPENYLRISDVITNIELLGDGRFAKSISMAGVPVRFEERFTCVDKNQCLETRSTTNSPIRYFKQMRFEQVGEHHTRMHIHFCYSPPGGELGNSMAAMFGLDAQSLLTDLFMRAKNFLETGREPHDATARRRLTRHGSNGSHRPRRSSSRGSSAPSGDARISTRFEESSPAWPRAEAGPPHPGVPMPFPPAIH